MKKNKVLAGTVAYLVLAPILPLSVLCAQVSWNTEDLNKARQFSEQMGTFAFMLYTDGSIITAWGDTTTATSLHSARKAISSTIYSIYTGTGDGKLDPEMTLRQLGIDDFPDPLSDQQKEAKVIHLMKSSSGINHAAAGETEGMRMEKNRLLGSGEHPPGTQWAYNNWDYNTLIAIFEQQTGVREKDAFMEHIALPLHMQDLSDTTVVYSMEPALSMYPIIEYNLSARDMLKFGRLCLNQGLWVGNQVIPSSYFERIVSEYIRTGSNGLRSGHGYFWWVPFDRDSRRIGLPRGTYYADGLGYQQIIIIPEWETVMVHKSNTNFREGFFTWLGQRGFTSSDSVYIVENLQVLLDEFLNFIVIDCREPSNLENTICQQCKLVNDEDYLQFLRMILNARN